MRFTRFYSTATDNTQGVNAGASLWEPAGLGDRWRHNYSRHVDLTSIATISTATVFRANGDRYYFTLSNGNWLSDADVNGKLLQLPNATGWRYTNEDDEIEVYDASGRLERISTANGLVNTELQHGQHIRHHRTRSRFADWRLG